MFHPFRSDLITVPTYSPAEARLDIQLAALTTALTDTMSLAEGFKSPEDSKRERRHAEIGKALKIAKRSAEIATALSKLRGSKSAHTINVQRMTGHVTEHSFPEELRTIEEVNWNEPAPFTKAELKTMTWDQVRERTTAHAEQRAILRASQGLTPYIGEPDRKLGDPPSDEE